MPISLSCFVVPTSLVSFLFSRLITRVVVPSLSFGTVCGALSLSLFLFISVGVQVSKEDRNQERSLLLFFTFTTTFSVRRIRCAGEITNHLLYCIASLSPLHPLIDPLN